MPGVPIILVTISLVTLAVIVSIIIRLFWTPDIRLKYSEFNRSTQFDKLKKMNPPNEISLRGWDDLINNQELHASFSDSNFLTQIKGVSIDFPDLKPKTEIVAPTSPKHPKPKKRNKKPQKWHSFEVEKLKELLLFSDYNTRFIQKHHLKNHPLASVRSKIFELRKSGELYFEMEKELKLNPKEELEKDMYL
jgi:hypothetical protein